MACKIDNRFLQVCLNFCWCPTPFNRSNDYNVAINVQHLHRKLCILKSKKCTVTKNMRTDSLTDGSSPVTLILLWNPKNTTGCRGVNARCTSVSDEICSIFFSGECKTQVCSESKSHDLIVQSCKRGGKIYMN